MKKMILVTLTLFSSLLLAQNTTTQAFLALVPTGYYQGIEDSGEKCFVSVNLADASNLFIEASDVKQDVNYKVIDGTDFKSNSLRKIFRQNSIDNRSAIGTIIVDESKLSISISNQSEYEMAKVDCIITVK